MSPGLDPLPRRVDPSIADEERGIDQPRGFAGFAGSAVDSFVSNAAAAIDAAIGAMGRMMAMTAVCGGHQNAPRFRMARLPGPIEPGGTASSDQQGRKSGRIPGDAADVVSAGVSASAWRLGTRAAVSLRRRLESFEHVSFRWSSSSPQLPCVSASAVASASAFDKVRAAMTGARDESIGRDAVVVFMLCLLVCLHRTKAPRRAGMCVRVMTSRARHARQPRCQN
jgi:hypothetical protein